MPNQFLDPSDMASMSDDNMSKLVDTAGFDRDQLEAQRAQAQQGLGMADAGAAPNPFQAAADANASAPPPSTDSGSGAWDPRSTMARIGGMVGGASSAPLEAQEAAGRAGHAGVVDRFANAGAPTQPMQQPMPGVPMAGGYGAEKAAARKEGEASKALIQADLDKQHEMDQVAARHQRDEGVREAQAALDQAQWSKDYMHHQNEAEDAAREAASGKLDPEHLYKHENGETNYGKKIGAALAVGLGAFGAGLSGGPNYALQIVNKSIDDDIAAQKENMAKKERTAAGKKQVANEMFQQHREKLGDDRLYRIQALQDYRQQLQDMAAKTTDPQAKAKAQMVDATVAKQQADITHQYAAEKANNTFRNRTLSIEEQRAGAAGGRVSPATQTKVANVQAAIKAVNEYASMADKGVYDKLGKGGAGAETQNALMAALARVNGTSLSSRNKEFFEKMAGGNPADIFSVGREERIKQLRRTLDDELQTAMAGGGSAGNAAPEPAAE